MRRAKVTTPNGAGQISWGSEIPVALFEVALPNGHDCEGATTTDRTAYRRGGRVLTAVDGEAVLDRLRKS